MYDIDVVMNFILHVKKWRQSQIICSKDTQFVELWTTSQTQATWIANIALLATIIVLRLAHGFVIISLCGWNSH